MGDRGRTRIILQCISRACTLRNCLSLLNGLISHEAAVCVSVSRERRGAKKTDVTGAAGAPASAAEPYIDFCTALYSSCTQAWSHRTGGHLRLAVSVKI
jgi:hypothetical protein